jgi:hypothetical protein
MVLEILGDQRIPYEGEVKRFHAEGDFLVRALTDLISQCASKKRSSLRREESQQAASGLPAAMFNASASPYN